MPPSSRLLTGVEWATLIPPYHPGGECRCLPAAESQTPGSAGTPTDGQRRSPVERPGVPNPPPMRIPLVTQPAMLDRYRSDSMPQRRDLGRYTGGRIDRVGPAAVCPVVCVCVPGRSAPESRPGCFGLAPRLSARLCVCVCVPGRPCRGPTTGTTDPTGACGCLPTVCVRFGGHRVRGGPRATPCRMIRVCPRRRDTTTGVGS